MDEKRRSLLKGAAFTSLIAGAQSLSACSETQPGSNIPARMDMKEAAAGGIDVETITAAEKIHGLSYSSKERAMLIDGLEADLETIKRVHALSFPNALAPALTFNPKLARKKIPSQKNNVATVTSVEDLAPDGDTDIAFASIAQQGKWIRSRIISSVQLTELYLKRIAQFDKDLNSFITLTTDIAMDQALKADKDLADGRDRGALHGIPYGLKDLADAKGVKTTWGANTHQDQIAIEDADIVRKLRSAGAVLLGKTSCGTIAYGDQWFGGQTKNPWNLNEGSGGSSAGSASATAAGLCSFSIGTETLGSIISPSERCGTAGLRSTYGRVSRAGLMALCWSLDKIGPICRHVEDTALVLSQINGYDADDPGAARVGFSYDGAIDVAGMTVGYVPAWFEQGDDIDRRALDALRDLGVTLKEFPWPQIDVGPLSKIIVVEAAAAFADLTLTERDDELSSQTPEAWPNMWRQARFFSAVDYVQVDRLRRALMEAMATAFDGFDALIGPHFAGGALLATNCTGHPQLALRAGFAQTPNRPLRKQTDTIVGVETFRTPRGISLWGDLFQEGKIIALAHALEEVLGVSKQRPSGFG